MTVPPAVVIGRFLRHYPGQYQSAHYRTTTGVIPFGLFWILHATMRHNLALDRVNETRAITHALASAFAGKDGAAERFTRAELEEAFLAGGGA